MSSARFSITGIYHVYREDDGKWASEMIEQSHITDCIMGAIDEEVELYVDGLEFPEVEGFYQLFATVHVTFIQDYWGDWDAEYSPVVETITMLDPIETEHMNRMLQDADKEREQENG